MPQTARWLHQPDRWLVLCWLGLFLAHRLAPWRAFREMGMAANIGVGAAFGFVAAVPMLLPGAVLGKLAENIVQATARDLLVESILEIEKCGYPVLFHVHDEVIVEVPTAQAETALNQVIEIMERPPVWAAGLPIGCEANIADCYGK